MTHMPQYILFVRRHDGAMQLIARDTGKQVAIKGIFYTSGRTRIEGVFVTPWEHIGVFLMGDEIIYMDEFLPVAEIASQTP